MQRVAVVTGAGGGIGRSATHHLLSRTWKVVLAGRTADSLQETASLSDASQDQFEVVPTDISIAEDVERLFATAAESYGRVDFVFNNAGINVAACPLEELSLEEWQAVVDVNLTGSFLCTQAAFRQMKNQTPQGGRILNNGSVSAHLPRPQSIAYTATKHAVTGLTRSTSLDGRAFHIACGQIDIGNASTSMTSKMSGGVLQADGSTASEPTIDVDHVGKMVADVAELPLDVNVPFVTIMANQMPYAGRG